MNPVTDFKGLILQNVAGMWRRRWYAIGVAWLVCVGGWLYVASLPDTYEAKTRVQINTELMLRPLLRGLAIDSTNLDEVDLMQRTLLSRPNLVKVSHMADLDLAATTNLAQEGVISDLEHNIKVTNQGRNLFTITYVSGDPKQAKKVVQSLLDILVESNLGNTRKQMVTARGFLDDQIRDYERELDRAEQRVAQFKSENIGLLGGGDGRASRVEEARTERDRTKGELADAQHKRDELKRQLEGVPAVVEVVNTGTYGSSFGPPLGPPLDGPGAGSSAGVGSAALRVSDLEQKLNTLLLRYTDRHPDVVETKRLLEIAKEDLKVEQRKRAAEAKKAAEPRTATSTMPNPIYERLKLQLIDEEATVATLQSRLQRNEADVRVWDEMAKSVPGVAAELTRLTRDYEVMKRNYNELVARREAAKIGQDMENQTKNVQFRLIDPPEAPMTPSGPNRTLFFSIVLVFGVGAGMAFAFVLSQLDSSIRHVEQLRTMFSMPVLGSISAVRSAWEQRRRLMASVAYGVACVILAGAYAGLLAFNALSHQSI